MEQRGIRTERGDINRAIKLANAELKNINARLQALEIELHELEATHEEQEKPSTTPTLFEGCTKVFSAEWEQPKTDTPKPIVPKTPEPITKIEVAKKTNTKTNPTPVPKSKPKAAPTPSPKPVVKPKTKLKPRNLKEVDIELGIIHTKLLGLKHASDVDMLYGYKIQDIERNLSSAGFWERRKMQKEIAHQEKLRSDFHKETVEKYDTKPQLEKQKDNLLAEKLQIENAIGVTAAREAEQQRKRDEVIQRHQDRDRYNAECKTKRLVNPNRNKDNKTI